MAQISCFRRIKSDGYVKLDIQWLVGIRYCRVSVIVLGTRCSRFFASERDVSIRCTVMYCYALFKVKCERKNCCNKIFLQAYQLIYESTDYTFENIDSIIRRFSNSFFKAFVKKASDYFKKEKDKKQLKKRKLNN